MTCPKKQSQTKYIRTKIMTPSRWGGTPEGYVIIDMRIAMRSYEFMSDHVGSCEIKPKQINTYFKPDIYSVNVF